MSSSESPKMVLEGQTGELELSDSGCAAILEIYDKEDQNEGMFVRLQSWVESPFYQKDKKVYMRLGRLKHEELAQFEGKKIRITVEVVDAD